MYINPNGVLKYQNIVFGLFLTAVLLGCGGGGSSSTAVAPPSPLAAPIGDLSGNWSITDDSIVTVNNSDCVNELGVTTTLAVTQSGNTLTVTDPSGNVFNGTISGNTISWTGSYPEVGGGTTTVQSLSATVAADCDSLVVGSGNSTWSWTDGIESCSGTSTFEGFRINPIGCGGGGGGGTTIPEQEPNDTPADAQPISLPVTITGSTIGDGVVPDDFDAFSFTVTATQTVTANLTSPSTTADIDLLFTAADGTIIDASINAGSTESLTGNFLPGTYLVVVAPFDVPTSTSYTLSVQ